MNRARPWTELGPAVCRERGRTSREVLGQIVPNDPLGVRPRVAARLREDALLLDIDHVCARAFALLARDAVMERAEEVLAPSVDDQVGRSIRQLLEEEASELLQGRPNPSDRPDLPSRVLREIAGPLGLDVGALRIGRAHFHALDLSIRQAFFLLILEGRPLDTLDPEPGEGSAHIAQRARLALDVLRHSVPPDSPQAQNFTS